MPANRDGTDQPYFRRKTEHRCTERCFPVKEVTFFCFACGDEIFRPQVAKHGNRMNAQREWEVWYLCKTCHLVFKDDVAAKKDPKSPGWLLTETGWLKQGRYGVPADASLRRRKRDGTILR